MFVEKTNFSQTIPVDAVKRFDEFCEQTGLLKWRAIVAAIEVLRFIPPAMRDRLMAGDPSDAAHWLEQITQSAVVSTPEQAAAELETAAQRAERAEQERGGKRRRKKSG